jgi:hypothetical protein
MTAEREHLDDEPLTEEEVAAIEGKTIGRVELDRDRPRTRTISLRLNDDEFRLFTSVAHDRDEGLSTAVKALAEVSALLELKEGRPRRVVFDILPALLADAKAFAESQGVDLAAVFPAALADYIARHRAPEDSRLLPPGLNPKDVLAEAHSIVGESS